jgi:hypothetical protein
MPRINLRPKISPASIAAGALVGVSLAGWCASAPAHYSPAPVVSAAVAVSVQHRPSQAVVNWYNKGGGKQKLNAVSAALGNIGTDSQKLANDANSGTSTTNDTLMLSGDVGRLDGAAANLLKDLPPGASRSDVAAGCHALQKASIHYEAGIFDYDSGDLNGATARISNASTAINQASTDLSNAATIIVNGAEP